MYNLLISANEEAWNGAPYFLETSRCIREYTNSDITKELGSFSKAAIEKLKTFPSIFAYENYCNRDPQFGFITDILERQGNVRVHYQINSVDTFLSVQKLKDLSFDLDIHKLELNRTHWAVKDVDLEKVLSDCGISIKLPLSKHSDNIDVTNHNFDIAFSFPGEARQLVEPIVSELETMLLPNSLFYDNKYVSQLARPSLDILLQDIYGKRSKLIVIFLSDDYQRKEWCGIEFRAIREIINAREYKKVMFVKLNDFSVDGIFKLDGFIDAKRFNTSEIAQFIMERVSLI